MGWKVYTNSFFFFLNQSFVLFFQKFFQQFFVFPQQFEKLGVFCLKTFLNEVGLVGCCNYAKILLDCRFLLHVLYSVTCCNDLNFQLEMLLLFNFLTFSIILPLAPGDGQAARVPLSSE